MLSVCESFFVLMKHHYWLLEHKHQKDLSRHSTCSLISRMQKLAQEQNEEIEKVNRERKYHQVIILLKYLFYTFLSSSLLFSLWGGNLKLCFVATSANHCVRAQCSISTMETALCEEYGDSICLCRARDTNRCVQKGSC